MAKHEKSNVYLRAPNEGAPVMPILHNHIRRNIYVLATAIAPCTRWCAVLCRSLLE